jgi:hypothetical protein
MPRKERDENRGAEFAQMDPDRRKRFEKTAKVDSNDDAVEELDFAADDPRDGNKMGRHAQPESQEREVEEKTEVDESGPVGEEDDKPATGGVW